MRRFRRFGLVVAAVASLITANRTSRAGVAHPLPDTVDGGACAPGSVSAFAPTFFPPAGPYAGVCSSTQITALIAACIDPATSNATACQSWERDINNSTCNTCFLGQATATTNQAVILSVVNPGEANFNNVGGCIYNADPTNAAQRMCGQSVQASFQCELAACLGSAYGGVGGGCVLPQPPSPSDVTALNNCMMAADTTVCASYASAATACQGALADAGTGSVQVCDEGFSPTATDAQFAAVMNLFCGASLSVDGGVNPDAGADTDAGSQGPGVDASVTDAGENEDSGAPGASPASTSAGCSCRTVGGQSGGWAAGLALGLFTAAFARRRRHLARQAAARRFS
jgi:MYXO-CTERM domain-containing protein